ncbi:MAG: MFS transporter [Firmicutes bacterium]|nr:MFS transporter [Bacillota bacterium]
MINQNNQKIWNKAFTCAFIANFLLCISQFIVNPLVATYADYLGASEVMIGIISGLYFGVSFAARPISGPAITMFHKKKIMIFAYALGVIVNVGYALAGGIPLFIVSRFLHGLQFAFIGSLNYTLASDSLPPKKLASGLGLFGAAGAIATAIAPSIGLALRSWGEATFGNLGAGYTVVFLVAAACMAISLIPCALMPYKHRSKEELATLGAWYKNIIAPEALLPAVVLTFFSMAQILYTIYMEPYALASGIKNIGLFFTVYAFVLLATRPLSGRLIDKYGIAKVLIPGTLIFALSYVVVGLGNSLTTVLLGAALAALGFGSAQPAIQVMGIQSVTPVRRGVASNTNYFGIDLGFFLGPTVGAVAYSYTKSYSMMFLLGVVPVFLALIIFLAGYKYQSKIIAQRALEAEKEWTKMNLAE